MRGNLPTPEPMPPSPAAIDDAIIVAQLKRDSANLACGKDFELWALLPRNLSGSKGRARKIKLCYTLPLVLNAITQKSIKGLATLFLNSH